MAQKPRPPRRRNTWLSILSSVTSLQPDQWLRLLALTLVTVLATLFILMSLLFIGTRFFGLRILAGQIFLDPNYQSLGAHVTVDATAGFQNSGIFLKAGQQISLSPEGRIHLASEQIYDFARSVKPLIVKELPNRNWPAQIKQRYQSKPSDNNVFYRDWVGPEGDPEPSDILEDCKLKKTQNWGTLLAVIIPAKSFSEIPTFSESDPFQVLKDNNLNLSQLVTVNHNNTEFTAKQDGWLTFIVNEAVISPDSQSKDAKDYYEALKRAAEELSDGTRKRIHLRSLPLVFFSDNAGAFRITVRY